MKRKLGCFLLGMSAFAQQPISSFDLSAIDKSVAPCENFYQYACGNWRVKNPIPSDQSRWSRFNELAERNRDILHNLLEKVAVKENQKTKLDQEIGDYYAACMDEKTINEKGVAAIKPELDRIAAIKDKKELAAELARMHREGVRSMFAFFVRPDAKDVKIQIASVDQGGIGLPDRDYYTRTDPKSVELRTKYEQHIKAMFQLLGYPADKAENDAKAVMQIETSLAKASLDRVARRNPNNTYHKMKTSELEALTPSFDWATFFKDTGIGQFDALNVGYPEYFKALDSLIKQTSLADFQSYLVWHLLRETSPMLSEPFVNENFAFFGKTMTGAKEMRPRWKRCVAATDAALGEALGQKFVDVAFSGKSKERTLQMVSEIEKEMEKDIKSLDWMTPSTKDQALTKLHLVTNKIGYPDKWKDYSSITITRDDPVGNEMRASAFEVKRNLDKLGKPVDKTEWGMTPPTVNAYYSPPQNNINFPAGILQPPFYDAKADDAVNYGSIGAVVGHELTHGFDDQGRRYDGQGNLHEWWTAADGKAFEERADCIVNEYGGFTAVDDVKLNGKLTLGENTADNGGIRLAYMALMDSIAQHAMPEINGYTPQQRFFLGYAQIWCQNSTPESSRMLAQTDPHSPGEYRVNGVLQNFSEFGKAFGCKANQPMVAPKGCRVW